MIAADTLSPLYTRAEPEPTDRTALIALLITARAVIKMYAHMPTLAEQRMVDELIEAIGAAVAG